MSNVLNVNYVEDTILNFLTDANADLETRTWFLTIVRKYIIKHYPNRTQVAYTPNMPTWAKESISNNIPIEVITIDNDFLPSVYKKYMRYKSARLPVDALLQIEEPFCIILNDNMKWIKPISKKDFSKYGYQMGSCLKNYHNTNNLMELFLLLDNDRAVIIVGVVDNAVMQIKGYQNGPINKKYWSVVKEFIAQWPHVEAGELPAIGLVNRDTSIYNVRNLNVWNDLMLTTTDTFEVDTLAVKGNVSVDNCAEFIVNQEGNIIGNLYCRNTLLTVNNLHVDHNIYANGINNTTITNKMFPSFRSLYLQNSNVINIYLNNPILGDLNIDNTKITGVASLVINKNFYARNTKITTLPILVGGSIIIPNTLISELNTYHVLGDLDISNTNITSLNNITIEGNLHICDTKITSINNSVNVKGVIFINQPLHFENKNQLIFKAKDNYDN